MASPRRPPRGYKAIDTARRGARARLAHARGGRGARSTTLGRWRRRGRRRLHGDRAHLFGGRDRPPTSRPRRRRGGRRSPEGTAEGRRMSRRRRRRSRRARKLRAAWRSQKRTGWSRRVSVVAGRQMENSRRRCTDAPSGVAVTRRSRAQERQLPRARWSADTVARATTLARVATTASADAKPFCLVGGPSADEVARAACAEKKKGGDKAALAERLGQERDRRRIRTSQDGPTAPTGQTAIACSSEPGGKAARATGGGGGARPSLCPASAANP